MRSSINFFFYGLTALLGLGLLVDEVSRSHSYPPHSVGHFWTSDGPIAETSTWPHARHSQETDAHALGGIRSRNPSKWAAADPYLRPRGDLASIQNESCCCNMLPQVCFIVAVLIWIYNVSLYIFFVIFTIGAGKRIAHTLYGMEVKINLNHYRYCVTGALKCGPYQVPAECCWTGLRHLSLGPFHSGVVCSTATWGKNGPVCHCYGVVVFSHMRGISNLGGYEFNLGSWIRLPLPHRQFRGIGLMLFLESCWTKGFLLCVLYRPVRSIWVVVAQWRGGLWAWRLWLDSR